MVRRWMAPFSIQRRWRYGVNLGCIGAVITVASTSLAVASFEPARCFERTTVTLPPPKVNMMGAKQRQLPPSFGRTSNRHTPRLQCQQNVYFFGCPMNLPFGDNNAPWRRFTKADTVDAVAQSNSTNELKRNTKRPYLEDCGPLPQGHHGPHASRWFDTHQLGWKTITFGSHFGAALTEDGDVYIWGSFIPPVILGPVPIIPTLQSTEGLTPFIPTLTIFLHQSLPYLSLPGRRPTYPESMALKEAETNRVFVGPIKLKLPFKVKDVQAGVSKLFLLTSKGQVYCHDNLTNDLHWHCFEAGGVPTPPVLNRTNSPYSAVINLNKAKQPSNGSHWRRFFGSALFEGRHRLPPPTLTSQLPSRAVGVVPVKGALDNYLESSGTAIISVGGDISKTSKTKVSGENPTEGASMDTAESSNVETMMNSNLQWSPHPEPFLLEQLPQPGYFVGRGIRQISAGLDHLSCVSHSGDLYCLGDNTFGQCGVLPSQASVVGVNKILPVEAGTKITAVSCGGHHTMFADSTGQVYALGDDSKLQLGLGDTRQDVGFQLPVISDISTRWNQGQSNPLNSVQDYGLLDRQLVHTPTPILKPSTLSKNCIGSPDKIVCGGSTTCLRYSTAPDWLVDTNQYPLATEIQCTGDNMWGQCGSAEPPIQQTFKRVKIPTQFEVVRVSCGLRHCVAFLSSGQLYGWGDNRFGQAGVKRPKKLTVPTPIFLEADSIEAKLTRMSAKAPRPSESVASTSTAEKLLAETTMPKTPVPGANVAGISVPVPRLSRGYGGDVSVVACNFNATGIIQEANVG